jgi:hypothetical protein
VVAKNSNEAMKAPTVGSSEYMFGGSVESASRFCIWQESGFICCKDVSHLIYFIKELYKCCFFNVN